MILIFIIAIFLIITALLIRSMFIKNNIDGFSMYPTFSDGEKVWSTTIFSKKSLRYGSIVTVYNPDGSLVIKRIAGKPGDRITVISNVLYVNGKRNGNYVNVQNPGVLKDEIILKDDEYFIIGDNYNHSDDSRMYGPIKWNDIKSKIIT